MAMTVKELRDFLKDKPDDALIVYPGNYDEGLVLATAVEVSAFKIVDNFYVHYPEHHLGKLITAILLD
jgi:hypothetical protein